MARASFSKAWTWGHWGVGETCQESRHKIILIHQITTIQVTPCKWSRQSRSWTHLTTLLAYLPGIYFELRVRHVPCGTRNSKNKQTNPIIREMNSSDAVEASPLLCIVGKLINQTCILSIDKFLFYCSTYLIVFNTFFGKIECAGQAAYRDLSQSNLCCLNWL